MARTRETCQLIIRSRADLHLDNLIFDARGGRSVVVLDWQTVSVGAPARDLAPFLFGSLSPEDRRISERVLLDRYAELLAAYGVRGYSREDLGPRLSPRAARATRRHDRLDRKPRRRRAKRTRTSAAGRRHRRRPPDHRATRSRRRRPPIKLISPQVGSLSMPRGSTRKRVAAEP